MRAAVLRLLLALGLALSQGMAVAHSIQHELLAGGDTVGCHICSVAHTPGAVNSNIDLPLVGTFVQDGPLFRSIPSTRVALVQQPPLRGPPASLV